MNDISKNKLNIAVSKGCITGHELEKVRNIEAWIDALRSGRYLQTCSKLRGTAIDASDNDGNPVTGFCCLGVACDISNLSTWKAPENTNCGRKDDLARSYAGSDKQLPDVVYEWAGLDMIGVEESSLIRMNDTQSRNFYDIALFIEQRLEQFIDNRMLADEPV